MKKTALGLSFALAAALAGGTMTPGAWAQAGQAGPPPAARPAVSHPDFSGIWINPYGGHRLGDPDNPKLVRPPIVPPKQTPEYEKLTKENEALWLRSEKEGVSAGADPNRFIVRRQQLCLPYGLPRTMTRNMSLDIQQNDQYLTIVGELDREIRRIWLDRPQKPLEEIDPGYWGRSVAHWEGDVLVVNTIGIRDEIFGEEFLAHSDEMVMEERIYLKEPDILYDEITLTDPKALIEPFKLVSILQRAPKDFEPSEFVCDQFPTHMIGPDGNLTINPLAAQ